VQLERDVIEQARNGALTPKAAPSRLFAACDAYLARTEPRRTASAPSRSTKSGWRSSRTALADVLLSTITREMIEGFQAKRKLDGVSNRTVNMDVGTLRKVLKGYGHWRRLQHHVTMLSEAEGAPIGRALTNEEQKRLLETAASNPEWEHVYCAAVLAANTSMRGVEVKHVRRKDVDLEKVWDVDSATGKGVLYVGHSKNETSKRQIPLNGAARDAITRRLKSADELGHTEAEHCLWCASQHLHHDPTKPAKKWDGARRSLRDGSRAPRLPVPRPSPHGRHGSAGGR
jgi:integrase